MSEDHLRRTLAEYIEHHNVERPHQGLGNVVIGPWESQSEGEVVCDQRLNGLLKSFRRAA